MKRITPPDLNFRILSEQSETYAGQIILYKVTPITGLTLSWVTEITHCVQGRYFVDEQRFGPYAFWHHQHFFDACDEGTLITDVVHYKLPFGIIGRIAHMAFVHQRLKMIFDYRHERIEKIFG
ncbi:MAG: hypothetical protein Kow0075_07490 [Salibacteraceae bacterium]